LRSTLAGLYSTEAFATSTIEALVKATKEQISCPGILVEAPISRAALTVRLPRSAQPMDCWTDTEIKIATIFADVLGRGNIGPHEDFFVAGGQSLLAMRVVAEISRSFGLKLSVRALFEHPTVRRLASLVETELDEFGAAIDKVDALSDEQVRAELEPEEASDE
jgi:acyl carrier protein